jgi:hypothetical protein
MIVLPPPTTRTAAVDILPRLKTVDSMSAGCPVFLEVGTGPMCPKHEQEHGTD